MKKLLCLALTLLLCLGLLPGCAAPGGDGGGAEPAPEENIPADKCRNWYEVFVRSYADSNGDGLGDLPGLTEKLDYIRSLGFTGLWLMPIMPSPSYHKYDVTDYCAVDPEYGTMADLEALLAAAHERDILVILDLPVNHSSDQHPWFQSAAADPASPYRDWYNFQDSPAVGWAPLGEEYYEARFTPSMPDLNLDNEAVRGEIEEILRFWLDKGVDGFRLDAVTSYYTGADSRSVAFLRWLGETARSIAPDCYLVGECWADTATIRAFYDSGIDSFFYFPAAAAEGTLCRLSRDNVKDRGDRYGALTMELEESFAGFLMAPFLGNHDLGRISGSVGTGDLAKLKAVNGMLAMMRGGLFYYYGDEIGMVGSKTDPDKRLGMLWTGESETTAPPPGAETVRYVLPSVQEQQADPASLLNYVAAAMALRNRFPAIARGQSTLLDSADPQVCLLRRDWQEESVTIVLNLSAEEKALPMEGRLVGALDASGGGIALEDGSLRLAPWGIALLQD